MSRYPGDQDHGTWEPPGERELLDERPNPFADPDQSPPPHGFASGRSIAALTITSWVPIVILTIATFVATILMSNAMAMALDPVPHVAGASASLIGTSSASVPTTRSTRPPWFTKPT